MSASVGQLRVRFVAYGLAAYSEEQQQESLTPWLQDEFRALGIEAQRQIDSVLAVLEQQIQHSKALEDAWSRVPEWVSDRKDYLRETVTASRAHASRHIRTLEGLERMYRNFADVENGDAFHTGLTYNMVRAQLSLARCYRYEDIIKENSRVRELDATRMAKIAQPRDQELLDRIRAAKDAWIREQKPLPLSSLQDGPMFFDRTKYKAIHCMLGGMGKIFLYAAEDANGNISHRLACKENPLSVDPVKWIGDVSSESFDRKAPVEFWAHHEVAKQNQHCSNRPILGLRSYRPQYLPQQDVYRMWLEYAGRGDLGDLIFQYYSADLKFPEKFIIYVFKSLVDACLIMKKGRPDPWDGESSWRQVVHRDIKPENIFLGDPSPTCFPCYPEPKLADFGLATLTSYDDPSNPILWTRAGTRGFQAPEQLDFIDETTDEPIDDFSLLHPCNVWAIGATLKSMLECRIIRGDEQPTYVVERDGSYSYWLDLDRIQDSYSRELCCKVQECLEFDPALRPSPEDLSVWLDGRIEGDPWLRNASRGVQSPDEHAVCWFPRDYQVGMALN